MPIYRLEVRPRSGAADPRAESLRREAGAIDPALSAVHTADVYFIDSDRLTESHLRTLADHIVRDAVSQQTTLGPSDSPHPSAQIIEVHPLPGVMDPVALSVEYTIRTLFGIDAAVRTAVRYDLTGISADSARRIAERLLANPVIHAVHTAPQHPDAFPRGHAARFEIRTIPLRDLDDDQLTRLSRDAHLFLSLDEMRTIRDHYRALGRDPRDIELETLAQTWSEHCVHKTLKSTIRYTAPAGDALLNGAHARPGVTANPDGSITIDNLLRSTVAAATHTLINEHGLDWCLSVFVDNAGVIAFDDETAVCFKVETHNHPSAIEPYGGAATGIGGCIRDIIGTGLAAKPIAATDVFCVAPPDLTDIPAGCLPPARILSEVVRGVRDYGNRMGIPTLNGAVWFDPRYVGNPLVYCGCIGLMPRDKVAGAARPGDRIIALGGRTGRDGIHGATFSSAELTDTHADEFSHAVQIGNAVTEKKLLDAILRARDHRSGCLFSAITDCGAGGFSSAIGEMGESLGAFVQLDKAPLKYDGLTYTEIWISEAQERMILAVPPDNVAELQRICDTEDVELADLGRFGTDDAQLILTFNGTEVGRLDMHFLHDGLPRPTRSAHWSPAAPAVHTRSAIPDASAIPDTLTRLLAHPNLASKHTIIRQYDHEVQGATVIRPLTGPDRLGPSDAAVITPRLDSTRGLAIANGLCPTLSEIDPYLAATAAIDECVRNLVCVGADPARIAILDNFCWPSCDKPRNLAALVRACFGCYDAALAFGTPFISGKDSLNNQFTTDAGRTIEIPFTLLISGFGIVPDIARCVTMDAKTPGNLLLLLGPSDLSLAASHAALLHDLTIDAPPPDADLALAPRLAHAVHRLIDAGLIASAHDCSEGGLLPAAAEMAFSGDLGLALNLADLPLANGSMLQPKNLFAACFSEAPSRYLLEIEPRCLDRVTAALSDLPHARIGTFTADQTLTLAEMPSLSMSLPDLRTAWRSGLRV